LLNEKARLVDGGYDFNEGMIATWYSPQFTDAMLHRPLRNGVGPFESSSELTI
jgi:hypothetical protein